MFALLEEFGLPGVLEGGLVGEVGFLALGFQVGALEVFFGVAGGGGGGFGLGFGDLGAH